jgi:phosphoglycolate phosphatase-like HAD superfamily hydrolase
MREATALYMDDSSLPDRIDNLEILRRFGRRRITHVFHDIDGTHSLIRDWPPVMSLVLHTVAEQGLPGNYDSPENVRRLIQQVGAEPLEETDRFCIESAGLSALTQMEWAIRRAVEEGAIPRARAGLDEAGLNVNAEIISRIWQGEELFDHMNEPESFRLFLQEHTPRLFRLYENILNGACRDANVAAALHDPDAFRVDGALQFMKTLHESGVLNYFVTGAVIHYNEQGEPEGGMFEEVCAVGFDVGPGKMVEAVYGSTWDRKIPKDEVMRQLCRDQAIDPVNVLIVGDGRSEIAAGVAMGAVTISRLPQDATRQRELHQELGTNIIVSDYSSPALDRLFSIGEQADA